jgi:FkbM family methyltransferase
MTMALKARQGAAAVYRWRWPVGWWRLRRWGMVKIGGQPIAFGQIGGTRNEWWALSARQGRWEQPVVEAFVAALRPGDVVYDVGAWIGPYTLLASKLVGEHGRVISFEPDPVARAQLEHNVTLNRAANVQIFAIALSDRNGTARLSGGGSEAVVGATGNAEVETMTLPDFIAKEGVPDLIKVDIEGGELRLDVEALSRARKVFLEVHVPAFSAAGEDPDGYVAGVAAGRPVVRLEGTADNYNVRIG